MKEIEYRLELAKSRFVFFISNMDRELSRWIQYRGVEKVGDDLYFKFKSSQNSLRFKVHAGVYINGDWMLLRGNYSRIYKYFKDLKYENIEK